ncbi:MAG: diguanylate cyclase [Magnetococcales bacterium]|nr:diguanylate cyclase [Magnetococcales bacterium]NGZ04777.1 diguanylate cyclase [Magnetococcales bacterium]
MTNSSHTPDQEFLKNLTVLFVEDDPDIHRLLDRVILRHAGTLITAHNGQEGYELYLAKKPDIIVTDILMPTLDGLAMTGKIRESDTEIPIIVTTAHNDEAYFLQSIDLGIDRYVLKPTHPEILLKALYHCARALWRRREQESANRYVRFILDIQPNLLLVAAHGHLEYINRAFLNLLGYSSLETFLASGTSLGEFLRHRSGEPFPPQPDGWMHALLQVAREHGIVQLRCQESEQNGSIPFAVTCNALPELQRYLFSFSDVTHLEKEKRQLEVQAFTDALTGVCNRARLQGVLNVEIRRSQRHEIPLAIILCDIDHFKRINDQFGHQVGDDVLRQVAHLMASNIRAEDTLARWGGEEFMIVSPQNDLENMRQLAEKLRALIEHTRFPTVERITCSFGVAQRQGEDTMRELTERADQALYAAKNGGRNRVEVIDHPN